MQLANEEAARLNHEYIGSEHILLGLVKEGTGVGAQVLLSFGVDLRTTRREVEKIVAAGPDVVTLVPQTLWSKKVIEYAIQEARALNHNYVGTEHMLLGLLRLEKGVVVQVLTNLGLSPTAVRDQVFDTLGCPPTPLAAVTAVEAPPPPEATPALPLEIALAVAALDEALHLLRQMKEEAVGRQDFVWAAGLRDQGEKLRQVKEWLVERKDSNRELPK